MASILITGASGFIGSFIVSSALRRGYDVWAGLRATSSRQWLPAEGPTMHYFVADYSSPDALRAALVAHRDTYGAFQYVVHCAGVTKSANSAAFDRVNHQQTALLADTLVELGMTPRLFVFLSSLSVMGPVRESDFTDISLDDTPRPNTAYGRSKLAAEQHLQGLANFPYIILRPTGVYGPRERDYLMAMRAVARRLDFAAGRTRQDLTFVYVADVAQAVFRAIDSGLTRRTYFLSDGLVYDKHRFGELVRREIGLHAIYHFDCPLWLLSVICSLSQWWAGLRKRPSTLNRDKRRIMAQRNWRCDIGPARREIGYEPEYNLELGIKEAIMWYKAHGWL